MPKIKSYPVVFTRKYATADVTLRCRVIANEGVDVEKLIHAQEFVVEPTNADGCVTQAELVSVNVLGNGGRGVRKAKSKDQPKASKVSKNSKRIGRPKGSKNKNTANKTPKAPTPEPPSADRTAKG